MTKNSIFLDATQYTKNLPVYEAIQYEASPYSAERIKNWAKKDGPYAGKVIKIVWSNIMHLMGGENVDNRIVDSLWVNDVEVHEGDYVVRDPHGLFSIMKKDNFENNFTEK